MNEAQQKLLLEQLRDIHLSEPISWWPLAIGWWFVIALLFALLSFSIYQLVRYVHRNRYRKQANHELEQCYRQWSLDQHAGNYISSANEILRRSVQHLTGDSMLVSQSGEQWLTTLANFAKEPLSENSRYALSQACYQADPQVNIGELHKQLCQWLKNHKRPKNA